MSKERRIEFYTEVRHLMIGGRTYLCGKMGDKIASREYYTSGWFQGMSIRLARKRIITELMSTQDFYILD